MGSGASTTAAASESFIDEALGPKVAYCHGGVGDCYGLEWQKAGAKLQIQKSMEKTKEWEWFTTMI